MDWKYANQTNFKVSVVMMGATTLTANHAELSFWIWDNIFNVFFPPSKLACCRSRNLAATTSLIILLCKSIIQAINF